MVKETVKSVSVNLESAAYCFEITICNIFAHIIKLQNFRAFEPPGL